MQQLDLDTLKENFKHSEDIRFEDFSFSSRKVVLITCESMIDTHLLYEVIVPRLQAVCKKDENLLLEDAITAQLHVPNLQRITELSVAASLVYSGFVLIYFEHGQLLFSSNIEKKPNRSPEETSLEVLIKGPRDNFIEDLGVNVALIRKRLPTDSLNVEKLVIGTRSKTKVAILYMRDIADEKILEGLRRRLQEIDTDIIISGDLLMERVNFKSVIIPVTHTTGRPDFSVQSLVSGRFVILVDGVSYAVITPVNVTLLLKTGEDNEYPTLYSSAERILRLFGLAIGLLLPAFWLALTTFHQEQLPFQLLATVVQANTGLPLPSALEMLIMVLMFELFREAGLRLPSIIGGTISVVGGLIIGDAAIRAGVTSPAMIVIIAISTIATFTLVNQSVVTSVNLVRIIFILVTSVLGLFGFFVLMFTLILYLANIRTFGVPFLDIAADLDWKTIKKSLFRLSPENYEKRPELLHPKDKTKEGGE